MALRAFYWCVNIAASISEGLQIGLAAITPYRYDCTARGFTGDRDAHAHTSASNICYGILVLLWSGVFLFWVFLPIATVPIRRASLVVFH